MVRFHTTQWSAVLDAAHRTSPEGEKALAGLCQVYWYPLYAYIRRQGAPQADAQDLTQQFFVHVLSTDLLAAADRQRGRFRAFLLTALKNFLANEHRLATAGKRGGPQPPLSLDFQDGEERYTCPEPAELAASFPQFGILELVGQRKREKASWRRCASASARCLHLACKNSPSATLTRSATSRLH